jgi:hypothetical protein
MRGRGERLLAAAIRLLPERRRDLGAAVLAEASVLPPGRRRLAWLIGGLWFVAKESAVRMIGYGLGLAVAVALLVAVDRIGTSDDSSQVSMLVLLVTAAGLGFLAPRWAWLAGLALGSALAVAGLVSAMLDPAAHLPKPGGIAGAATLFVLLVPAMVGAYLGAGAAWLIRRSR